MDEDYFQYSYAGSELEIFAHARNWKRYFAHALRPYIFGNVLEVGAGIGSVTDVMVHAVNSSTWLAIEPDPQLFWFLETRLHPANSPSMLSVRNAALADLAQEEIFDTIIYIDVLEHIEDDKGELARAANHLSPGGHIVVLAPAYQSLYAPFDAAVGHHRRYNLSTLRRAAPQKLVLLRGFYLDCVGVVASAVNCLFLKQRNPTAGQIAMWDRFMVPCSQLLDRIFFHRFGRSVVAVWQIAS